MKVKSFKDICKLAEKVDKKLKCKDKRFDNCVKFTHRDGSSFFLRRAFVLTYILPEIAENLGNGHYDIRRKAEEYFAIFSEHHGYKVYSSDEITHLSCYKIVDAVKGKLK